MGKRIRTRPARIACIDRRSRKRRFVLAALCSTVVGLTGCGTILQNSATEQLLASDAVDSAVSSIDFRPLAGQKVFFETRYIQNLKTIGFVSAEYIISSLRQAMVGSGVLLQDTAAQADLIVEARVGTLGADGNDIIYGLPSSNAGAATAAAAAATSMPTTITSIPEISLAKKKNQLAAAKVACFAYARESKERVWQSGLATAKSTAQDSWFLGAGPFQKGSIYTKTGIAGSTLDVGRDGMDMPAVGFREPAVFEHFATSKPKDEPGKSEVITASGEEPAKK
ncbi:hypothetical protein Pan44_29370 [Caulifigura coniformis]|uniref:Uncharacterized protein n=1 Tax=Caulifigura coniformis TaxID=2527983 RepID=A0A517SFK2_9PLAN|nr:DUF6655 family protein [Caulifigura coniformis]QDT54898.1 hypothetical protein Pan44_29370 [Caulifigura coniformis]